MKEKNILQNNLKEFKNESTALEDVDDTKNKEETNNNSKSEIDMNND